MRLARILYRNCGRNLTQFRIQAIPGGGGACRVDFEMVRPWLYKPGTHAYVYLPRVGLWQSHPFSIAWSREKHAEPFDFDGLKGRACKLRGFGSVDSKESLSSTETKFEEKPASTAVYVWQPMLFPSTNASRETNLATIQKAASYDDPWSERNTMSMVISKRTGFTRSLWEKANRAPNKTIYLSGFLEGQYGGEHGLHSYGQVVLVAGGVGITHCVGWARELLKLWKEGRGVTRKVILIWVVPDKDQYEWCREWFDEIFAVPDWEDVSYDN